MEKIVGSKACLKRFMRPQARTPNTSHSHALPSYQFSLDHPADGNLIPTGLPQSNLLSTLRFTRLSNVIATTKVKPVGCLILQLTSSTLRLTRLCRGSCHLNKRILRCTRYPRKCWVKGSPWIPTWRDTCRIKWCRVEL